MLCSLGIFRESTCKFDTFYHRVQIFEPAAAAFFEVVEVYLGHLTRIRGAQRQCPSSVVCVSLDCEVDDKSLLIRFSAPGTSRRRPEWLNWTISLQLCS